MSAYHQVLPDAKAMERLDERCAEPRRAGSSQSPFAAAPVLNPRVDKNGMLFSTDELRLP
jgi:hypothetical protein